MEFCRKIVVLPYTGERREGHHINFQKGAHHAYCTQAVQDCSRPDDVESDEAFRDLKET